MRRLRDARPLDSARTIKIKLGLLVATSIGATSVVVWYGLTYLHWMSRYTVLAAIIVALAITQVLAHGMTSPLREMTEAARAMARGDYSRRVRATSRDEVGELAGAFNRMAADLAEADRTRRELVANVSHELRTPISALQALLENMVDGVSDADPATLRTALGQTERLGRLVADLLDLSRLESGAVPLAPAEFEVRPFLTTAIREAGMNGEGVTYTVDVSPAGLQAVADPQRLAQVVANLLDNARRHSPPGGRVTVAAGPGEAPGALWIEVADEGPGIPPGERDRVFERFTHGGPAGAAHDSGGGTGLGLAIARWAVDLHGGRIAVAGGPGAGGCRIRVVLPGTGPDIPPQQTRLTSDATPDFAAVPNRPDRPDRPLTPARPVALIPALARIWPPPRHSAPWPVLAGAAVTGLLTALLTVGPRIGVGVPLAGLAAAAATWPVARARLTPWMAGYGLLALALLAMIAIRSWEGLAVLCLLGAFGLASLALAGTRTGAGVVLGGATVGLAGLRMPPWAVRSLAALGRAPGQGGGDADGGPDGGGGTGGRAPGGLAWPVLRSAVVAAVLLLLFGALFASADAAFRDLVDRVLPEVSASDVPQRVVAFAFGAGLVLAGAYVAVSPPRWDELTSGQARPLGRFEWALPIVLLDALFAAFGVIQVAVLFGGHERVLRSAGLTYAEYARTGFGQLAAATALTLAVVAAAARLAPRASAGDRKLVRVLLGVLCGLTLLVVASALRRLALYEDAYGLTVDRLLAAVVELWFGALILMTMAAGIRLRGDWLPRAVVASGGAALLVFTLLNPAGFVASRNIDRFERTGKIDTFYLGSLPSDAVPALDRLREPERSCVLSSVARGLRRDLPWHADSLGNLRARQLLDDRPLLTPPPTCPPP
jgi:signal transduction histidine kinase